MQKWPCFIARPFHMCFDQLPPRIVQCDGDQSVEIKHALLRCFRQTPRDTHLAAAESLHRLQLSELSFPLRAAGAGIGARHPSLWNWHSSAPFCCASLCPRSSDFPIHALNACTKRYFSALARKYPFRELFYALALITLGGALKTTSEADRRIESRCQSGQADRVQVCTMGSCCDYSLWTMRHALI